MRYPAAAFVVLLAAGSAQAAPPTSAMAPPAKSGHEPWNRVVSPFAKLATDAAAVPHPPAAGPVPADASARVGKSELGIPKTVADAYHRAERTTQHDVPGCRLNWTMLAAIGKVESGHADDGDVTPAGDVVHPIFGPALDGTNNVAAIPASSGSWVRAEGPMQMLPSTWGKWSADGNSDGRVDPQNVYDASLGASRYLCGSGRDLSTAQGQQQAIWNYNPSEAYVQLVTAWMQAYQGGFRVLQDMPGAFDPNSRAHAGASSIASETPPTPPAPPPTAHQPAPDPPRKPTPAPTTPTPAPKPSPAPILPRLLPPPAEHLLPVPVDTTPPPQQPSTVDGITPTVGQLTQKTIAPR